MPAKRQASDTEKMLRLFELVIGELGDRYLNDRREYGVEEIYNWYVKGGLPAILGEIRDWIDNDLSQIDPKDPLSKAECPHAVDRAGGEPCDVCDAIDAAIKKHARYDDPSQPARVPALSLLPEDIADMQKEIPPQPRAVTVLCACGSRQPIDAVCGICLESACSVCGLEHGPGKCDSRNPEAIPFEGPPSLK